ncbi:beta-1 adrenergic receptor [Biomphalaria glabrata]|uniref:Beta-1 adrenergic receptor-like n=1 Tax=Biomphalaria glabrata TaxID=6526 RepID=A0A9W3A2G3_BIOGL|nr:beta-1 adrenergic receptor-like [Biomphalaria glabrata]XP_055881371.1 beta-1 adrenergic receptor-like [Biomphalaria glabrata]XP_055881372.1 beta-1 adrenergic receptor-like [Biomphalaria glabrata]XP_055881374.1 beta-1 adrenergic receptor-like [Biomphalaria glabrata]XP_055881375.1 beta-1 adrenergic receptor-like [Biomphalaria glabrata]XP_055881376.1 beta-1 adrenergic receptor-like [Biomphalaria glabrata]XP_055881377.1 beta-1 adrenergic receptor-like [Biomphalaria glabrata]XP_055881378.1 bet
MDSPPQTPATDPPHDGQLHFSPVEIPIILFTVWAIVANSVLILAILRNEHRRQVSFNLHVCNLSSVGLLLGCFVLPLLIDFNLKNFWSYDDNLCRIWLMADLLVCTVSVLVVLAMVFDRFVLFSCPGSAEGTCKYVLSALLIILPWVLGTAIVLPIYLFGETGDGVKEGVCYLHYEPPFPIVSELAGFIVPGLATFGLLVATTLTFWLKRQELREMDFSEEREHKGWQVLMLWILTVAVLGLWSPFAALRMANFFLDQTLESWITFAIWFGYASSGVNPILWMIMPRLRQSVKALLCCCSRKHRYDEDDSVFGDETSTAMMEGYAKS